MPGRWLGAIFALSAVVFLVPVGAEAQTGGSSVTLKGTVSETVALSILPNSTHNNIDMDVMSTGATVRMTLSGSGAEPSVIHVPLLVRSNSGFRISAAVESTTAVLSQLAVADVRATGALVSPLAVSELDVPQQFDLRNAAWTSSSSLDISHPLLVLSGPRVSLGGTLESPNNALQITLLICMKPQSGQAWLVHLTFAATAIDIW
jgi:hypothetical protein